MVGAALVLLLAGTHAPDEPRTLVLVLDAIPYEAVSDGTVFAELGAATPLVGTFPSTTTPAFAAMLRRFGVPVPPGYEPRYFDRSRDETRLGGPIPGREDEFRWHGFFDWIERGLSRKTMHYARPRRSARREVRDALAAFEASADPVFLAYVNSTDGLGHLYGPGETRAFLRDLDDALRALRARLPFRTVLLSDHGMGGRGTEPLVNVRRGAVRALEGRGFRLREGLDRPDDAVLLSFGIVTFFALYTTPGREDGAMEALSSVPGIEVCARPDGAEAWVVAGPGGKARIARDGALWSYAPTEGDPLGYGPAVGALRARDGDPSATWFEDGAWFEATRDADLPDALHRVAGGFALVENPASVLCSLAPGHVFGAAAASAGARLSRGPIRWSHGSLRREDSVGFIVSDVPGAAGGAALRVDEALAWIP